MMMVFTQEEEKYLLEPARGPYICHKSQTPSKVLDSLVKKDNYYFTLVGMHIIDFQE
jgi:hypothetical protein